MEKFKSDDVNSALQRYIGYGIVPYPNLDYSRVGDVSVGSSGHDLKKRLDEIMEYADKLRPDWSVYDFDSGCNWIAGQVALKYPKIDEKSMKAISWAFSYWLK